MTCPHCGAPMKDVTDAWATFEEARGAEYVADYATIFRCERCTTIAAGNGRKVDWVIVREAHET